MKIKFRGTDSNTQTTIELECTNIYAIVDQFNRFLNAIGYRYEVSVTTATINHPTNLSVDLSQIATQGNVP